jgi:hypothetical protein
MRPDCGVKTGQPPPAIGDWPFFRRKLPQIKIIAQMKGRIMKVLTGLIACCWALAALFSAELCRADDVFLASMGNILAMSDVNQSLAVPSIDSAGYADPLQGQKQNGVYYSQKESTDNIGSSYADLSASPLENAGSAGGPPIGSENADSPFERYLLIAMVGGTVGLVLIAAGIAQFWRRRSVSNYWLFPATQVDGEPAAQGASTPAPLIAKKQMETLPEEKINKPAQRRAA